VIRAAAAAFAAAIAPRVGEGVQVVDHPPDTAAGPVIWLELLSADFAPGVGWQVRHQAVIVAAGGLESLSATDQLGDLTDQVIVAATTLGPAQEINAQGGQTRRIGGTAWPACTVSGVQVFAVCDLPQPLKGDA
jgi:hypothetical protein